MVTLTKRKGRENALKNSWDCEHDIEPKQDLDRFQDCCKNWSLTKFGRIIRLRKIIICFVIRYPNPVETGQPIRFAYKTNTFLKVK